MTAPLAEGPPFHLPWRYLVGALALLPLGLGTGHAGLLYAAGALAAAGAALAAFDLLASLYRQGEPPCPSPTTPS